MFTNANDIRISGGVFQTAVHGRVNVIETLATKIAPGAFHDGARPDQRQKCHPGTRTEVLYRITNWIYDTPRTESQFLWIYGPAGAGKTAIAETIAKMYRAQLGGAFFFNRHTPGRNDKTLVVLTLVYQLIQFSPELGRRIVEAIERDPSIFSRSLEAQLRLLVVRPLNEMDSDDISHHEIPNVVILDGLNECADPRSQHEVLRILKVAAEEIHFPLLFLIFSREDKAIRDFFNNPSMRRVSDRIILNESYHPDADIRLYLRSKFQDISLNHPAGAHLPKPWPSNADIDRLVDKSSGQFIYASTVIEFIESRDHSPEERLNTVFRLPATPDEDSPFAELDALYHEILSSVANIKVKDMLETLSVLFLVDAECVEKSPRAIERFLSFSPGRVGIILSDLHSAFGLPEGGDGPIRVFHASLIDFLLDRTRSGNYYIDVNAAHASITRHLLKSIMQEKANSTIGSPERHGFLYHCPKSAATPELLLDLYGFDLKEYLVWISNILLVRRLTPTIVPKYSLDDIQQFLTWFKDKTHSDYSNDLFQHHLESIDNWIHGQLSVESKLLESLSPTSQLCLGLKEYALEIFDILGTADSRPSDCVILSILSRRSKSEYPLLHQFLCDPARGRSFFLSEDDYTGLACKVMKYIVKRGFNDDSLHPYQIINALESESQAGQPSEVVLSTVSVAAGISRDKSALDLISFLLPKASNSLQLETLLRKYPFVLRDAEHIFCSEKREAAQAAENYLKVYEKLNVILASQSLQSEKETSRAIKWIFSRRESMLIVIPCFLIWWFR